jgi:hypothetical protein
VSLSKTRARTTWLWGLGAALALLWPDRVSGPFDGVPLDRTAEALLIGVAFPALWWFHPRFLDTTRARVCIVALLAWKLCSSALFVQDGFCVRFEPQRPFAKDAGRAPHAWDLRADWRTPDPACSAVMTRSYVISEDLPVWFFNLPPPNDSFPDTADRPPAATVAMRVHGYLTARSQGVLQFDTRPDVAATLSIDGHAASGPYTVEPGTHFVAIDAVLTGDRWALVPRWNGTEMWDQVTATLRRPSTLDLFMRPWSHWIPTVATLALLLMWSGSAIARLGDLRVLGWSAGMSLLIGYFIRTDQPGLAAWTIAALAAAVLLPVPRRLRNIYGACALIAVPWLVFVAIGGIPTIGRVVRIYPAGNDEWLYQRYGYRIVMQGYWLEGGSPTFYFQPLYRWIVGLIHSVFGDSSVGERFWDGMCLLAGAMLSFRITRAFAGFRWGLVAAATTLAVFALGRPYYLIGFGLSEISSAGLLSMAALCAIRSRRHSTLAIAAGVLATLAFYTRLNNGIMAAGIALFALPLGMPVRDLLRPQLWWRRVSWLTVCTVGGIIALGVLFFTWRTWYYTGVFNTFYGTQRYIVSIWQPDMPMRTILGRLAHSVMMVLTVNDPPRFDPIALPVLTGALVAVLAVCGAPYFRDLPAAAVLFFFASIAGAFVTYGWEWPGRFSVHVLPITCALAACAIAALLGRGRGHPARQANSAARPARGRPWQTLVRG